MHDPLAPLLVEGVIDEVVARLKGGKEADVWLVRAGGEVVAAKVYKARQSRSFKNDASYREGRKVRNTRTQRAMDRGSRFGQAAAEEAWKAREADALFRLHAAGVRVPRPVLFHEGVLLMELVLDARGHPAQRLVDAPLAREQAAGIYADLRTQAVGMLSSGLIHGDLSPYNVLAGARGPVVIDLPQVVDAAHNSQAESFFLRDLEAIRRFCASIDPALGGQGDGREIWRAWVRRELTPDFVPTGRPPPPPQGGPHAGGRPPPGPRKAAAPAEGRRRPGRGPRHAPVPEVVRVGRLPQANAAVGRPAQAPAPVARHTAPPTAPALASPAAPTGGAAGGAGGARGAAAGGAGGGAGGGRRRRRRRRRGGARPPVSPPR